MQTQEKTTEQNTSLGCLHSATRLLLVACSKYAGITSSETGCIMSTLQYIQVVGGLLFIPPSFKFVDLQIH